MTTINLDTALHTVEHHGFFLRNKMLSTQRERQTYKEYDQASGNKDTDKFRMLDVDEIFKKII